MPGGTPSAVSWSASRRARAKGKGEGRAIAEAANQHMRLAPPGRDAP